ncbi:kinase-like domain-containing protein [Gigaspora rosea]|uniref:Kinase-like domain-containing protein n=1 Tax=Gigaspora rosea TaxID=44941 RepID=A0A397VEU8_9GLOM|nr:kinase-like domain-containing protein [Gigaspora rosea]
MSNEDLTKIIDDLSQLNFIKCQELADVNDPYGLYMLGYCYEYGIGTEKDENKAFTYYQKSADMNDSNGMYQVGYCYYLGIGVEPDNHKAFKYYLMSAKANNSMGIWKTAICYKYGIGVEQNDDEYDEWIDKYPKYGKCAHCKKDNTNPAWCLSCDPDLTTRWTIENMVIDDCMKTFQLRAKAYEYAIEWIPFDKLSDIKKIGEGGFSLVFSASWSDGIRKVDGNNVRTREPSSTVALKTLAGSKEDKFEFLKEFKNHMKCMLNYCKLTVYGITQNTETKEYLMVFQYAKHGSLRNYLRKNFSTLTWQDKLQILKDVSDELNRIHDNAEYIHTDFHSGNILQDTQSYIADLGLARQRDEKVSEGEIYGVMPYVAPEVLSGKQQFTSAADIYGLGVIMAEMTNGLRPFDGREFNTTLAVKICKGCRPKFAPGTPECYIELAKKCMNSDPKKRPEAYGVYKSINDWFKDDAIKKQFLDADEVIKSLPESKHPDKMYTSKIINTKSISKELPQDSAQINLDITEV